MVCYCPEPVAAAAPLNGRPQLICAASSRVLSPLPWWATAEDGPAPASVATGTARPPLPAGRPGASPAASPPGLPPWPSRLLTCSGRRLPDGAVTPPKYLPFTERAVR